MRKLAFAALPAIILALSSGHVLAQTANSNSNSDSRSGASASSGVQINNNSARSVRTTSSAIAPGLVSGGIETCQGSSSVAVGGTGWGVSFGSTRMDKDCNTRLNAKMVGLLNDVPAAKQVMCTIPEVREAYAAVGRHCIGDRRSAPVAYAPTRTVRGSAIRGGGRYGYPVAKADKRSLQQARWDREAERAMSR